MKMRAGHIIKGVLVRLLLSAHAALCVWRVVAATGDWRYWGLLLAQLLVLLEAFITLSMKQGTEWKWFCPSVLIYLISVIPCLWFLELDRLQIELDFWALLRPSEHCSNFPNYMVDNNSTLTNESSSVVFDEGHAPSLVAMTNEAWLMVVHQSLLLLLVLERFLLPKLGSSEVSREHLTLAMLVYVASAADILEFISEGMKVEMLSCDRVLLLIIMIIWSWSLLQYTLGPCSSNVWGSAEDLSWDGTTSSGLLSACSWEVKDVAVAMFMQDGPFLVMRLYFMIRFHIFDETTFFFAGKNFFVLMLQVYHLCSIFAEHRRQNLPGSRRVVCTWPKSASGYFGGKTQDLALSRASLTWWPQNSLPSPSRLSAYHRNEAFPDVDRVLGTGTLERQMASTAERRSPAPPNQMSTAPLPRSPKRKGQVTASTSLTTGSRQTTAGSAEQHMLPLNSGVISRPQSNVFRYSFNGGHSRADSSSGASLPRFQFDNGAFLF
ncbi:transmembrane protein 26-like [Diadema antillarum]|uniref:transmembrane protein 26-like n=1 Tax=Diadema antillarum TaxID=105358 RepID=UPI003A864308